MLKSIFKTNLKNNKSNFNNFRIILKHIIYFLKTLSTPNPNFWSWPWVGKTASRINTIVGVIHDQ